MTTAREMWAAIRGQDEEIPVIVGAILVYVLTFLICLILQRVTSFILPRGLSVFAADFFFTLAVCSYPYSHGTLRQLFGHAGYVCAAVPLVTLTCLSFDGCGSPLGVFVNYLRREESAVRLVVRILVQTVAAFLAFRLVYLIWSMEITEDHRQLLRVIACQTDLNVSAVLGFLLEFSAVLYDTWLSQQQLFKSPVLDLLVKIFNGCLMVCGGVHLTGMYMHPAMASGMSWACDGTTTVEHIFVYWVSSFLGCYAGLKLHSVFRLPTSAATSSQPKQAAKEANGVSGKKSGGSDSRNNNNDVLYVYHRKRVRAQRREKRD